MIQPERDPWYEWLKKRRFANDPEHIEEATKAYNGMRDRVLEPIDFVGEKTLLDVGCGDGLIAFGALGKNLNGQVIFCDISQDLLDDCQKVAGEFGVIERCTFLHASAENLSALPNESVDAITTRSVLIYVDDKRRALSEFHRVLRKGGRLSIFEPINRFGTPQPEGYFWGYDIHPVWSIGKKIRELYETLQPFDSDPMMNFDERDLLEFVEDAGFQRIEMKFTAIIQKNFKERWDSVLRSVGNPKIPSLEEAMEQVLTPEERLKFEEYLRSMVETGHRVLHGGSVFLWAEK